jgi:hypothetical protein
MTVLIGQTSAGTTADFFGNGHTAAWRFQCGTAGDLRTLWAQLKLANAPMSAMSLGIYSDGAGGTVPGNLLASAAVDDLNAARGTGLFSATLSSPLTLTQGTFYWLAIGATNDQIDLQGTSGSGRESLSLFPSPWSDGGAMVVVPVIYGDSELPPAYPVIESVAESAVPTTAATSHTVTYPSGIQAGDLLLMIADKGSTAATIAAITGWTELIDENLANGLYAAWKKADGTESGTFTVTTSANTRLSVIVYRISGAADPTVTPPQIGSTATGTSATPNPPSLSPTGGSKAYLWVAFAGMAGEEADDDTWGNTPPTDYSPSPPRQKSCGTVGTNLGGLLISAERQFVGASQDPGTFGVDVSAAWRAQTIAIHPAPSGTTYYGQVAAVFTFSRVTAGQRKTFGRIALPLVFAKEVVGKRQTFGQTTLALTVSITTAGIRIGNTYFGSVALPLTFGKEVLGQRKTFGQIALPIILSKEFIGLRTTFGRITSPFTFLIETAGIRVANTYFGSVTFPITFGKEVLGQRKTFGQISFPISFTKEVIGRRQTFGRSALQIIFAEVINGRRTTFSQIDLPILFSKNVVGKRKTFGQIAFPISFTKSIIASKQTFASLTFPITFQAFVDGQGYTGPKTLYGQFSLPIIFGKDVLARRTTFGQTSTPLIFGSAVQGERKTFSSFELPIDFESIIESGPVGVHGKIALGLLLAINTNGIIKYPAVILNDALDLYLGEQHVLAAYYGSEKVWP